MEEEIWKPIVGYEGRYEVSNMGRVRSIDHINYTHNRFNECVSHVKGRILKLGNNRGYKHVRLSLPNGIYKIFLVHRLVAESFVPNPLNRPQVDHINTNPSDNRASNLRWTNQSENLLNEITRKKISDNTKMQMLDPRARENISLKNKGSKRSAESRKKMSESHKGAPLSMEHRAALQKANFITTRKFQKEIIQYDEDMKEINRFESITQAAVAMNGSVSTISVCLRKLHRKAYGFYWRYAV